MASKRTLFGGRTSRGDRGTIPDGSQRRDESGYTEESVMRIVLSLVFAAGMVALSIASFAQSKLTAEPRKGTVQQTTTTIEFVAPKAISVDRRVKIQSSSGGLTFICHLYGSSPQGGPAYLAPGNCAFPVGFKIDRSYQQKQINCCGGGASSPIRPSDVPAGIDIEVDGGLYWSVLPPVQLVAIAFDDNNVVTQWGINIGGLYCGPGAPGQGGCNIKVDVYAKSK
jgi:hypothetical protein